MSKTKVSDMLKHGEDFKIRKLDPNDHEVIKMLEAVIKEQKKILKRKEINLSDLADIVINI
jgi:hypothetical protein